MSNRHSIEVRYATLTDGSEEFDEVVAFNAYVHLEKMNRNQFCLIVRTLTEQVFVDIGSQRAPVNGFLRERNAVNGRSEGQRRRWAALTPEQRKRKRKP